MKKLFTSLILSAFTATICFAQLSGKLFQGTLKPGSAPNSVKAVIKSSATFTGKFSNVQFTFQLPNTISPQPVVTIKNNPLAAYIPTANYVTQVTNEGGFYNYLFAAAPTGQPTYNFIAGTEIDALEVQLIGRDSTGVTARLASLSNGGSTGQLNFYIEVSGNDNTNSTAMFYQSSSNYPPVNGGSYAAYSYVAYAPVALPLKIVSFNVQKKDNNAILNWAVENQSTINSHFEIERSTNGSLFDQVSKLSILNNGNTANTYNYTDINLLAIKDNGLIYYRLKQVDKDGRFVYSEIKKVQVSSTAFSFGIISNPIIANNINFAIQSQESGKGTLRIYSSDGKVIHQSLLEWATGYTEHIISVAKLTSGTYFSVLVNNLNHYSLTFIK
jgi:hypothetical protein